MIHYTLNTGHSRESPRAEVGDAVVDRLLPILSNGRYDDVPLPNYRTVIERDGGQLLCSVFRRADDRPCVMFGVAADAASSAKLWPTLSSYYLSLMDLPGYRSADFAAPPTEPPSVPWCAAVCLTTDADEAMWIADFERCLAWALIEDQ